MATENFNSERYQMVQNDLKIPLGREASPHHSQVCQQQLLRMMLDENFERLKLVVYSFPLVAGVVVGALWLHVHKQILLIWYLAVLVISLGNLFLGGWYEKSRDLHSLKTWARIRVASSCLNAAVWGCAVSTVLFPRDNVILQAFILLLVGGTTGTSLTTTASFLPGLFAYQILTLVPFIMRLLWEPGETQTYMAALATLHLLVLVFQGLKVHATIRKSYLLEISNGILLKRLAGSNETLNVMVAERTAELQATLSAQAASEQRLAKIHTLLEAADIGILVVDPVEGTLLNSNAAAAKVLETTPRQLKFEELPSILQLQSSLDFESSTESQAQSVIRENLEFTFCYGRHGETDLLLILVRDVRSRLEWEERIRHSQKMEVIGRLAGEMAHDFNNLLMAVYGYASLLEQDCAPSEQRQARQIIGLCDRGKELTAQLLALSSDDHSSFVTLDVKTHLEQLAPILDRLLGDTVELQCQFEDGVFPVAVDPSQLDRVLLNLTINAKDAMDGKGTLVLSLARRQENVRLTLQDDGPGISEEVAAKLFEPFFTTKHKGTGLGLAASLRLVRGFAGELVLDRSVEKGACFHILLPLSEAEVQNSAEGLEVALPREGSGHRILVVEDQKEVLEVVSLALCRAGYQVSQAGSAEQALEILRTTRRGFDLVISDAVLPKMSGIEMMHQVAPAGPCFLIMSGYVKDHLDGLGDTPLLRKPFQIPELLSTVSGLLSSPQPG